MSAAGGEIVGSGRCVPSYDHFQLLLLKNDRERSALPLSLCIATERTDPRNSVSYITYDKIDFNNDTKPIDNSHTYLTIPSYFHQDTSQASFLPMK